MLNNSLLASLAYRWSCESLDARVRNAFLDKIYIMHGWLLISSDTQEIFEAHLSLQPYNLEEHYHRLATLDLCRIYRQLVKGGFLAV